MKKDNWFLEDRKIKWYDIVLIAIYIVLIILTIAIVILGQTL